MDNEKNNGIESEKNAAENTPENTPENTTSDTLKTKKRRPTVLITDDQSREVTELALILKNHGFVTQFCLNDGHAVFKALECFAADFIVCDVFARHFGALDVIKRLDIYPVEMCPKVIAFSFHYPVPSDEPEILECGIDEVFGRPFSPHDMLSKMLGLLPKNVEARSLNALEKMQTKSWRESQITDFLLEMSFSLSDSGFDFVKKAIELTLDNNCKKLSVTKELYPALVKNQDVSAASAEHAIRHAISKAFKASPASFEKLMLPAKFTYKAPTNSEFILRAALTVNKKLAVATARNHN